jgi:arylsulfatase A-like enzyme
MAQRYEESIHIPVTIIYPGFRGQTRYDELFNETDLAPSIADLMGFPRSPNWKGNDIFAGEGNRRTYFFANGSDTLVGYREGSVKVFVRMRQPGIADLLFGRTSEAWAQYDLTRDPHELDPSAPTDPATSKQRIADWVVAAQR